MPKLAVATHTPVAPSEVTIADGCVNCTYTVSGSVTVPTGSHDCEFGLVYSVDDNTPTVEEGAQKIVVHAMSADPVSGTVNFTADITSLTEDVRYYVRAYAMCDEVAYSSEGNVKTVIYSTPKPLPSAWNNGINPHAFSVGEGKQVYFSQGNLQYKPSTDTWRFAEHQFDMVDVVSGTHGTSDYVEGGTNWIDFFCWGTTGHDQSSEDPYYIYFQPWSTSRTNVWGGGYNLYGYGPSSENPHGPHLLVEYYSDWGCNKIDNGGNAVQYGWYTPKRIELDYLLHTRANAASLYAEGKVGCINGLIVLPDVWNLPQGLTFNAGFASGFNTNTYTYSQWALMESAGAVFLPAAGYRGGATNYSVGTYGCYWASTFTYTDCGGDLDIQDKTVNAVKVDSSIRYWGLSVRLVYPAN